MNKQLRIGLIVLTTLILTLALTSGALAGSRQTFSMTYDAVPDWTHYNAVGHFDSFGSIADSGDLYMHWTPILLSQITMVFEGADGNFTARLKLSTQIVDGCYVGKFVLFPGKGTGIYEGVMGAGKATMCGETLGDLVWGSIEGWVIK